MHFPWPEAKITFEVTGKNLTLDIQNESPVPPDQEGIFEDYDDLSGIYNEELDYEVIKCVKYRRDGDLVLESTYGGFTIIEMNERTSLCKERYSLTIGPYFLSSFGPIIPLIPSLGAIHV